MNGIIGPPAEVLQLGSPISWQRDDVNVTWGSLLPLIRFYNLGVLLLGIGRM